MLPGVIIKKIEKFQDARGWLGEFFRKDEDRYQPAMGYLSLTRPGIVRGPHEHTKQSDFFIFAGPGEFEVHLWDNRKKSPTRGKYLKIKAGEKNPISLLVPPGIVHGYKCVSRTPALSFNLPDRLYRGRKKKGKIDEIRHEQDPHSPFHLK
jgi:dTDP-4-dehydrorhamnose 3,5-epimerase